MNDTIDAATTSLGHLHEQLAAVANALAATEATARALRQMRGELEKQTRDAEESLRIARQT
jgi:hypothetical protein